MNLTEWQRARVARANQILRTMDILPPIRISDRPGRPRWEAFDKILEVLDREFPREEVA